MKNSKIFQYIVLGIFIFFIVIGAVLFATYRSKSSSQIAANITMWGTLPAESVNNFTNTYLNNIKVKSVIKYKEIDQENFDRDLVEALAAGDGPDAIILPEDLIMRFSNKIYTIPYTVLPELTFKQTYIQEGELYMTSDGILALPFTVDPLVMYWNRDIFNNVGLTKPPVYWSEVFDINSKITKKDISKNISRSTVALGEFQNVTNAKEILAALIMQAGNPIVTRHATYNTLSSVLANSQVTKNAPASVAVEFYTNFSNPNRPEYSWNRSLPSSLDTFANGDLAIYFGFASEYLKIKDKNPNLNFDVTFLPQSQEPKAVFSTYGNMMGLAILKNSKQAAATYSLLSSLASAEAVPFWTNSFNLPSARRDILAQSEKNAAKTIFSKSAVMSRGWLDPNSSETDLIFKEMIESYTTGRSTINAAVQTASDKLNTLLQK